MFANEYFQPPLHSKRKGLMSILGGCVNQRQQEILRQITDDGFVQTDDLARFFDKTPQTIRRDFAELEKQGLLKRVHGGASSGQARSNKPYKERLVQRVHEKEAIAAFAATLIPNNSHVFISVGTSAAAVAVALQHHTNMRFMTNNLNVAHYLSTNTTAHIGLCGGAIRPQDGAMIDARAVDFVRSMRFDYGVIGIGGIADDGGLYCYSLDEVNMAQAILRQCQKIILVATGKKAGFKANYHMGNLNEIDAFITDKSADKNIIEYCKYANIAITLVNI